jgi:hypothetical protein
MHRRDCFRKGLLVDLLCLLCLFLMLLLCSRTKVLVPLPLSCGLYNLTLLICSFFVFLCLPLFFGGVHSLIKINTTAGRLYDEPLTSISFARF